MTLTATTEHAGPPATGSDPAFDGIWAAQRETWFTTTDHRRIARLHLGFIFLFLVLGGALGVLLRAELIDDAKSLFDQDGRWSFGAAFNAHATLMVALVLAPLWTALATLVLPTQIGSARLAFPRLQSLVLWSYVVGGVLLVSSYLVEDGPVAGGGITLSPPASGSGNRATDLMLASLAILALSALLAAVNFSVTVLTHRRPGLRVDEVPHFTLATFVSSGIALLSLPVFLGGLLLTYLDLHFGGSFFSFEGTSRIWVHTVWLFGRPDAFLLVLPALGAISDIVAARTGKPLPGGAAPKYLLLAFGVLSLGVWASRDSVASALYLPTARPQSALVVIPLVLLVLLWLGSIAINARSGGLKADVSLLFVAGFVALIGLGLVMAVASAIDGGLFRRIDVLFDKGWQAAWRAGAAKKDGPAGFSEWRVGHVHTVLFAAPLLAGLGALTEWAPRAYGRKLTLPLGGLAALAMIGGAGLMGLMSYLMGFDGAPAFGPALGDDQWEGFHVAATAGGVLMSIGALAFIANVLLSVAGRKGPIPSEGPADERGAA